MMNDDYPVLIPYVVCLLLMVLYRIFEKLLKDSVQRQKEREIQEEQEQEKAISGIYGDCESYDEPDHEGE